jgi:hypothetical protein
MRLVRCPHFCREHSLVALLVLLCLSFSGNNLLSHKAIILVSPLLKSFDVTFIVIPGNK